MNLEPVQARESDRDVVGQLLEFNSYEFSRIDGRAINRNGRYGYQYLDAYWSEPGRVPTCSELEVNSPAWSWLGGSMRS